MASSSAREWSGSRRLRILGLFLEKNRAQVTFPETGNHRDDQLACVHWTLCNIQLEIPHLRQQLLLDVLGDQIGLRDQDPKLRASLLRASSEL